MKDFYKWKTRKRKSFVSFLFCLHAHIVCSIYNCRVKWWKKGLEDMLASYSGWSVFIGKFYMNANDRIWLRLFFSHRNTIHIVIGNLKLLHISPYVQCRKLIFHDFIAILKRTLSNFYVRSLVREVLKRYYELCHNN